MDRRAWQVTVHRAAESDRLNAHTHTHIAFKLLQNLIAIYLNFKF